jgi:hypothetical protein
MLACTVEYMVDPILNYRMCKKVAFIIYLFFRITNHTGYLKSSTGYIHCVRVCTSVGMYVCNKPCKNSGLVNSNSNATQNVLNHLVNAFSPQVGCVTLETLFI